MNFSFMHIILKKKCEIAIKKRKISPKTEKNLDISVKNRNSGWKTEFLYSEIKIPASKGVIFCMEPYGPEVLP